MTYSITPKSAHWLVPSNDIAWFLTPGTRVGLLCRVPLTSPSNVSPTMTSNGKYSSGPKAENRKRDVTTSRSKKIPRIFGDYNQQKVTFVIYMIYELYKYVMLSL